MIKNEEILSIDFWKDPERIIKYCYSIINYVKPQFHCNIEVNFKSDHACVESDFDYSHNIIKIPVINLLDEINSQIYKRAYFLRHELAHIIYTQETIGKTLKISQSTYNSFEDIRIERLFSKEFRGSYSGFKSLRYVHYAKNSIYNISNFISENNFSSYIIYRSYGFKFPDFTIFNEYESIYKKYAERFNDLSIDNYIDIASNMISEFIDKFPQKIETETNEPNIEKLSDDDIKDMQLNKEILQQLAPEILKNDDDPYKSDEIDENLNHDEDEEMENDFDDLDEDEIEKDFENIDNDETEENFEDIDEDSNIKNDKSKNTDSNNEFSEIESTDTDVNDDSNNDEDYEYEENESDNEDNEDFENQDIKIKSSGNNDIDDDYEDFIAENSVNNTRSENEKNPYAKEDNCNDYLNVDKNLSLDILTNFEENIKNIINTADFDFVENAQNFDLCEVVSVANFEKYGVPKELNDHSLLYTYNGLVNEHKQSIVDLSLFLKRKTQNKIVHKIKPFQLDGDVDESNISDIFCSKEPRIFKNESYHYSPNNNILILIDFSGSMYTADAINDSILLAIQMFEASRIAKFNVEIYGFTNFSCRIFEKKRKNFESIARKFNKEIISYINRRNKMQRYFEIGGDFIFRILDTKNMRNNNEIANKKKFLANLYIASIYRHNNLFNIISGGTPEISAMAFLTKHIKNNTAKSTIFMINDGMYSDHNVINNTARDIILNKPLFMSLIFNPDVILHMLNIANMHKINLFCDKNEKLFRRVTTLYEVIMSHKLRSSNGTILEISNLQIEKFNKEMLQIIYNFMNKLNKTINNSIVEYSNQDEIIKIFNFNEFNKNSKYIISNYDFNVDQKDWKFMTLIEIFSNGSKRIVSIKLLPISSDNIMKENNISLWDIKSFVEQSFKSFFEGIDNAAYREMLNKVKNNMSCKILTIGIKSEAGKEYNDDFIYINSSDKMGTVVASKLKSIW